MHMLVGKINSLLRIEPAMLDSSMLQTKTERADRLVLFIMPLLLYVFFFCIPVAKIIAGPVYVSYCLLYGVHLYLRADKKYLQEPRLYYILLLLYLIAAALSLTYTPDFINGLKSLKTQVGLIMIPVLIETVSSRDRVRQYLYAYAFGGTILAFMIIYQSLVLRIDRPGALWHAIHGAHLLTFAVVVSLALFISEEKLSRKLISLFLFVSLSFALYLNGSRGAWAALGVVLFVSAFIMTKFKLYSKILCVAVVLLSLLLVLYSPYGQKKWGNTISMGIRIEMWKASTALFLKNPMLGVGIGGWEKEVSVMVEQKKAPSFLREFNQTHNIYFDALSTRGIVGLLSFMAVLIYPLSYAWKKRDKLHELFRNTVIFTGIAFMVAGLTDGLVDIRWSFLSYIALTGVGLAILARNTAAEEITQETKAALPR
jgi:O-antigen ligase